MIQVYEKVGVFLRAHGLKKMDFFSNTDAFAVIYQKNSTGEFVKVGRTEVVEDNQNPEWTTEV
jgi:hypothetical protein